MARILVTGAKGQVGKSIKSISLEYAHEFYFYTKSDLDIADPNSINKVLDKHPIDWIINCAAYTKVDQAENDTQNCNLINREGAKNIGEASANRGIKVIHLSSDYVYHSNFGTPFSESSPTNPQSVYAFSKLEGEKALRRANGQAIILRTSWVYSEYGKNFVKTMMRLGEENESLNVVCDQIGAPTYARDLAEVMLTIIDRNIAFGIYNFANSGVTSWYNLANSIFTKTGISCLVKPIRTDEYPTAALRPPYSVLDLTKIKSALQIEIRDWDDALEACLKNVTEMV